jgi:hypothetical protein
MGVSRVSSAQENSLITLASGKTKVVQDHLTGIEQVMRPWRNARERRACLIGFLRVNDGAGGG